MSEAIKRRRGTTAEHAAFIGLEGEITVDVTKKTAVVHDGVTAGGFPLARADEITAEAVDVAFDNVASGLAATTVQDAIDELAGRETLPAGGATGQILAKASNTDGDATWVNPAVSQRHIYGLTLSNNTTDAANRLNISPGSARDDANTVDLALAATLTKRLHNAWSIGHEGGFLDTGTKAADSWYHVWLIRRDSDGLIDALASLSATNPTMPAGWSAKRRIGIIGTDAAGVIRPFRQTGDYFGFGTPVLGLVANSANNLAILRTLPIPQGLKLRLYLWMSFKSTANDAYGGVKDPDEGVAGIPDVSGYSPVANQTASFPAHVWSNAAGQIYTYVHRTDGVIPTFYIKGWHDPRGQGSHGSV